MQSGTTGKRALYLALALIGILSWTACGGGDDDSAETGPTKLVFSPSILAVERGQVVNLSATAVDNSGNVYTRTITYTSASTSTASVSAAGAVCGGSWDSSFVVCTPAAAPGATKITATSGTLTASVDVYVHEKITAVVVTPNNPACVSQKGTLQFSARTFAGATEITNQVGPAFWSSSSADVATLDANGLATAKAPGQAQVFASVSNAKSAGVPFQSCPIARITLAEKDTNATEISTTATTTKTLNWVGYDVNGNVVETWNASPVSTNAAVSTFTASNKTLTTPSVGFASVQAACLPNDCNVGLDAPVYSNPMKITVTGTAPSTVVYATSSLNSNKSLVPIDTSTNTAGTAITLPQTPNSMVFGNSTTAYLGSSGGLMVFTTGSASVTSTVGAAAGKVLAVDRAGTGVITSDGNNAYFTSFTGTTPSVSVIPFPGVTAASFTSDGQRYFLIAGNALFTVYRGTVVTRTTLNSTANDVSVSATNSFVYIGGGSAAGVGVRATCFTGSTAPADVSTVAPPLFLSALPTGEIIGADANGFSEIVTTETPAVGTACPPTGSSVVTRAGFGSTATPRALLRALDGSRAVVTTNTGNVFVFNNQSNTASSIPLTGATESFTGAFIPGNTNVYVGAGDSKVHRLDVAAGTDAQQITLSFVPDIVAVKP